MSIFRVYSDEEIAEAGRDGYPAEWHQVIKHLVRREAGDRCIRCGHPYRVGVDGILEPANDQADNLAATLGVDPRAVDLSLELVAEAMGMLDDAPNVAKRKHWSACDSHCVHAGPFRHRMEDGEWTEHAGEQITPYLFTSNGIEVQALWRILTVHHLDGNKANCRWWNLVALCQRCHLTIQGKVQMARVWPWEHSAWFRPYVAGFYAASYLGEELSRSEVDARLDELLDLERVA